MATTTPAPPPPPPQDLRKSVLVTGAGVGGIGGELAKQLHAKGYRVFACYRRAHTVEPLEVLGIETVELDVTSPASVAAARDTVAALTGGKLHVLINNAGRGAPQPCTDLDIDGAVKAMYEVNVFGVMRVVQAFAHLLIAAAETDDGVRVVNIGSVAPIIPLVFGAGYNSSKAAMHAYSDCLRIEMKPFNVHVLTVMTGGVKSAIVRCDADELPANSLYASLGESWRWRVSLSQVGAMDTAAYARAVVDEIAGRRKRPWFWQGNFAWKAWLINAFMWKGFSDYRVGLRFGLPQLGERLAEQRRRMRGGNLKNA